MNQRTLTIQLLRVDGYLSFPYNRMCKSAHGIIIYVKPFRPATVSFPRYSFPMYLFYELGNVHF